MRIIEEFVKLIVSLVLMLWLLAGRATTPERFLTAEQDRAIGQACVPECDIYIMRKAPAMPEPLPPGTGV